MLYLNLDGLTGFAEGYYPDRMARGRDLAHGAVGDLRDQLAADEVGPLSMLSKDDDLGAMVELSDFCLGWARQFVLLGTGGSSLGPQALARYLGLTGTHAAMNDKGINWYFPDNLDGQDLKALMGHLDLSATLFLVVSKSGNTMETAIQAAIARHVLEAEGLDLRKHMLVVTQPNQSPLADFAEANRIHQLAHPEHVGGRYAMFSVVGMFPAMLMGVDPRKLRAAGREILDQFMQAGMDHDAVRSAIAMHALQEEGYNAQVMYLYGEKSMVFGAWYRQLWAESVGKQGSGIMTDVVGGPVGQHSQLQLHLDGPSDKIFTLLTMEDASGLLVPADEQLAPAMGAAVGLDIDQLTSLQAEATGDALRARNAPVRRISMDGQEPEDLARLMVHMMIETIIFARLSAANPFDQPAVEEGKIRLRELLNQRAGRMEDMANP